MHQVTQTNGERGRGDCFPACIASILEQPLSKFPIENCSEWNSFHWGDWLAERGITLFGPPRNWQGTYYQGEWIAVIPSIVNEGGWHAVVMRDDKLAWDPSYKCKNESVDLATVQIGWLLVLSDMKLFRASELYARDKNERRSDLPLDRDGYTNGRGPRGFAAAYAQAAALLNQPD